jgi:hypothetical protein
MHEVEGRIIEGKLRSIGGAEAEPWLIVPARGRHYVDPDDLADALA